MKIHSSCEIEDIVIDVNRGVAKLAINPTAQ